MTLLHSYGFNGGLAVGLLLGIVLGVLWGMVHYGIKIALLKRKLGSLYRPRGRTYEPPEYIAPSLEPQRPQRGTVPLVKTPFEDTNPEAHP